MSDETEKKGKRKKGSKIRVSDSALVLFLIQSILYFKFLSLKHRMQMKESAKTYLVVSLSEEQKC